MASRSSVGPGATAAPRSGVSSCRARGGRLHRPSRTAECFTARRASRAWRACQQAGRLDLPTRRPLSRLAQVTASGQYFRSHRRLAAGVHGNGAGPSRRSTRRCAEPGGLRFLGRVGAGLAGRAGDSLRRSLSTLELEESPFVTEIPRRTRSERAGCTGARRRRRVARAGPPGPPAPAGIQASP